jgi:thiamine biosynthesis lipoprotein
MTEFRHAQYVMGTLVEITAFANADDTDAEVVQQNICTAMGEFERLEKMFSRFDPDSELSRVNREAAQRPVKVSAEFFDVIAQGQEYAAQSAGCFSLQLAPLVKLWEACVAANRLPDEYEVISARRLADASLIGLDRSEHSIRFAAPGVELDCSGLVKGYAADSALESLQRAGCKCAIVNAGTSSIAVIGANPGGRFAVRDPRDDQHAIGVITLMDRALATSGTAERQFDIVSRQLSHLIDPRTGWPLEGLMSATAICASAMQAEVVAKLLLLLGLESALDLCDRNDWRVEALLLKGEDGHSLRVMQTAALQFKAIPIRIGA